MSSAPATRLSLPAKCFLFGEYAVLADGPALVLTFPPEFELRAEASANETCPFHPESSAGRLWASDPGFFANWKLSFRDPFLGAGGFGRSSAEFGTLFLLREDAVGGAPGNPAVTAWKARAALRELHQHDATAPSGTDLLAQLMRRPPGVALYADLKRKLLQDLSGMPPGASLFLVHSGKKAPTHDHLKTLDRSRLSALAERLNEITSAAHLTLAPHEAAKHDDRDRTILLGDLFTRYARALEEEGLLAPAAKTDLEAIRKISGVLGAKGCGALGADVYAVITFHSDRARFLRAAAALGLERIFDVHDYKWLGDAK